MAKIKKAEVVVNITSYLMSRGVPEYRVAEAVAKVLKTLDEIVEEFGGGERGGTMNE